MVEGSPYTAGSKSRGSSGYNSRRFHGRRTAYSSPGVSTGVASRAADAPAHHTPRNAFTCVVSGKSWGCKCALGVPT
eukprot:3938998-Rhodomonas_salina.2